MSSGNSVTALYADSNKIFIRFETQTDANEHFGIPLYTFFSYLKIKERQVEKMDNFLSLQIFTNKIKKYSFFLNT
jgi:hypothetical protein